MTHDTSEIIIICTFAAQETFQLLSMNVLWVCSNHQPYSLFMSRLVLLWMKCLTMSLSVSALLCSAIYTHLSSRQTIHTHTHTHTHTHNLPFCPDNFPLVPDGTLPCQNQPPMPGRSLSLLLLSHNYALQGCEVLPLGFYQLFLLLKERSQHCRMTVCVCVCVCVCVRMHTQ